MTDISQIGRCIRAYREKQGIAQRQLAEQVMVSFQAIGAGTSGKPVAYLAVCPRETGKTVKCPQTKENVHTVWNFIDWAGEMCYYV